LQLFLYGYDAPHIDTAKSYLHVREQRPNRGKEIDAFNREVGNALGSPYCAAFAGYCIRYGGAIYPKEMSGLARHYYSRSVHRYTAGDVMKGKEQVRRGDLVIWQRGSGIYGHVAFAYADWQGIRGVTIEGNTAPYKQKEGVWIRVRKIQPYSHFRIIGFARVLYE